MGPAGDEHHEGHDDPLHDDPLEAGDDRPRGAPPDRLDRLWVHPVELAPGPRRRQRRPYRWVVPLAAGVMGAVVTVAVLGAVGTFDESDEARIPQVAAATVPSADPQLKTLAEAVAPSLVAVTIRDVRGSRRASGISVRRGGEILTSAQFVGDATEAQVTASDGETSDAAVVGRDNASDLVLLEVDRSLPVAPFSATTPRAGDPTWLVGAPTTGGAAWLSSAVIAATDALAAGDPGATIAGLLETDALASSWAAGGALVDGDGAVTGIVLGPIGDRRSAYAIPITDAMQIVRALREEGYVARGSLGLLGVDTALGPKITEVPAGGAAARAGVHPGDVVMAVAGRPVLDMGELTATVRTYAPGRTVVLELRRGDTNLKVDIALSATEPEAAP